MNKEFAKGEVGKFGENACARYMKRNKLKILERNSRIGHLETDIIGYNKTHIVFTEVKTRRIDLKNTNRPASAIDKAKCENLIKFAFLYLKSLPKKFQSKQVRIDVCEIFVYQEKNKLKVSELNYIEGAITR
jgi:putative endonuclease